jgi:hypothetical protein
LYLQPQAERRNGELIALTDKLSQLHSCSEGFRPLNNLRKNKVLKVQVFK